MILERYIHREVLQKLLWITGLLILILTSHRFVDYLADAAAGKIPGDLILRMLFMKMLAISPRILPISIFLAVILAFTRLTSDKEMVIMAGAGISNAHQFIYVFKFAFMFAIFVFLVSNFISPWSEAEVNRLKIIARQESDIAGISAGRFKEFSQGGRVVYVENISDDKKTMENIFLQVRENDRFGILYSDFAQINYDENSSSRYVVFENGHRYLGRPGRLDLQKTDYRKYAVLLDRGEDITSETKPETVSSMELARSEDLNLVAEFQWRISFVIATILLPLFAVILSKLSFGNNRYVSIIIGILVYFIYSNLTSISKTMLARGDLPEYIGIWWVHLSLILIMLIILVLHLTIHRRRRIGKLRTPE